MESSITKVYYIGRIRKEDVGYVTTTSPVFTRVYYIGRIRKEGRCRLCNY